MTYEDGTIDELEADELDITDGQWEPPSGALFSGDNGGLGFEERRCLVALMKNRYISRSSHPKHWVTLTNSRIPIEGRLNDLFLTLHLDEVREVAYKRQAVPDGEGERFPTVLFDQPYTREETVLLVAVRERLQRERAAGNDVATVDYEDLVEDATVYLSHDVTDVVAAQQKADRAIDSLSRMKILEDLGEGRYAVSPVLDSLLPIERLRELLDWLTGQVGAPESSSTSEETGGVSFHEAETEGL